MVVLATPRSQIWFTGNAQTIKMSWMQVILDKNVCQMCKCPVLNSCLISLQVPGKSLFVQTAVCVCGPVWRGETVAVCPSAVHLLCQDQTCHLTHTQRHGSDALTNEDRALCSQTQVFKHQHIQQAAGTHTDVWFSLHWLYVELKRCFFSNLD